MREKISRFLAILLCAALIIALPCAAFADGEDGGETPVDPAPVAPTPAETEAPVEPTSAPEQTPAPEQSSAPAYTVPEEQVDEVIVTAETVEDGVLDSDELKELIENFLDERGIAHDRFRLGYTYTGTNETWYYNGDVWSYSASVYKLPLMMMLAQKVANGELKQDDKVCGVDLTYAETSVLTYSNNDYAHVMIHYFDSEQDYREQQVKMSDVPVEDIPERYYISSHFSPRFVIGVLRNLYENPDQFPNIVECLKVATPGQYLSRTLGDEYEVSQELMDRFAAEFACIDATASRMLDLSAAIREALVDAGVDVNGIVDTKLSTVRQNDRFYSYRNEGGTCGRHAAIGVML